MNIARAMLIAMMLVITANAAGRYLLALPVYGANELITDLIFPVLIFFSMSYVLVTGGHVRVELWWRHFGQRTQTVLHVVFDLAMIAMWIGITYMTGTHAYTAFAEGQQSIGTFGVPPALTYGAVAVGSGLMALRLIQHFIFVCGRQLTGSEGQVVPDPFDLDAPEYLDAPE